MRELGSSVSLTGEIEMACAVEIPSAHNKIGPLIHKRPKLGNSGINLVGNGDFDWRTGVRSAFASIHA